MGTLPKWETGSIREIYVELTKTGNHSESLYPELNISTMQPPLGMTQWGGLYPPCHIKMAMTWQGGAYPLSCQNQNEDTARGMPLLPVSKLEWHSKEGDTPPHRIKTGTTTRRGRAYPSSPYRNGNDTAVPSSPHRNWNKTARRGISLLAVSRWQCRHGREGLCPPHHIEIGTKTRLAMSKW